MTLTNKEEESLGKKQGTTKNKNGLNCVIIREFKILFLKVLYRILQNY